MTLRQFKSKYKCIVNPRRRRVYDFKKKRHVTLASSNMRLAGKAKPGGSMPTIGFKADCCDSFDNYNKLFLVDGKLMHEECAIKQLGLT